MKPAPLCTTLSIHRQAASATPWVLSRQRRRLESEGLEVAQRGNRLFVRDFEQFLAEFP